MQRACLTPTECAAEAQLAELPRPYCLTDLDLHERSLLVTRKRVPYCMQRRPDRQRRHSRTRRVRDATDGLARRSRRCNPPTLSFELNVVRHNLATKKNFSQWPISHQSRGQRIA